MKKNNWGKENEKEGTCLATTLADATERALLAARVEGALRRGTFVLWTGGFLAGVAAYFGGQDAATAGRNVAVVLTVAGAASFGVDFFTALRRKSSVRGKRSLALLAAKRLEKRFLERAADIVAAIDFSFEEKKADERTTDYNALRDATVVAATRRYAELTATLDKAELNAALTGLPSESFRKMGKKSGLCALAVLVNLVIWGISEGNNEAKAGREATIGRKQSEDRLLPGKREGEGNERNEENSKNIKNGKEGELEEVGKNVVADGRESETESAEEISLGAMETLISELAQNAEIVEALKEDLERAVEEENTEGAKRAALEDATTFLQLARELRTNLARPETGLVALICRLNEAARRERQKIEERLTELEKISEIGGLEKEGGARRISGKDVAMLLTALRLTELETRLTVAGGIGDTRSLGLSRILRSGSAIERRNVTLEAAARVGEWGATLRREETAARILIESLRYDAASQRRRTFVNDALQENRALLIRFAGLSQLNVGAASENDEILKEGKRRFDVLWGEARLAEKECVAIFERLRECLQSEETREFRDFVERNGGTPGAARFRSVEADKAVDVWFCDSVSRNEATWERIAENVENNRFGRAAEYGENAETTLGAVVPTLCDVKSEVAEERMKKNRNARSDDRRFSALAAALTQGVDAMTTQRAEWQSFGNGEREGNQGNGRFALGRGEREENKSAEGESEDAALEKREREIETASPSGLREEEPFAAKENARIRDDVTNNKERVSNVATPDAVDGEEENGKYASDGETANQNGANANGFSGKGGEAQKVGVEKEPSENKAFTGELPLEARRRLEGTEAPEVLPEHAEKIRLYRLRILNEERR